MGRPQPGPWRVTMFGGGRGAASIARGLLDRPGAALTLLINGYDNGLSTGALRRYLPGMLGPSDFRKNLLLHLDAGDPRLDLLEHRLPGGATPADLGRVIDDVAAAGPGLEPIVRDLKVFAARLAARPGGLDLADCALGNLVFAGAYLRLGGDFNAAVRACAEMFGSPVALENVTGGENAYLAAVKADGTLLADEADIVGPQDAEPITGLVLLREPLTARARAGLTALPASELGPALALLAAAVTPNPRALAALRDTDLIVYGPGTPHSSLLPSYLTPGVAEAIDGSGAVAKVFVVNLRDDHDSQGLSAADLVDRTLAYLGDPGNERDTITHVLCHGRTVPPRAGRAGVRWVAADLEDERKPGTHCGVRTVEALAAVRAEMILARAG
ncbi:2-phospho-L-lactate transferase CofD family protein [Nonomuraea sp. SBT364]|uniref:2-phospho-L-lactate transferase CofD family protein n=1 Tax=Nonomuraea sp. SBT364 TaxID=1580530 RepID=UPI00066C3BA8|nr:2-phospho-L-lactate transferase CofD family protein [Nonomuraea sp. SBT364]